MAERRGACWKKGMYWFCCSCNLKSYKFWGIRNRLYPYNIVFKKVREEEGGGEKGALTVLERGTFLT